MMNDESPSSPMARRNRVTAIPHQDPMIYKLQSPEDQTLQFESRFESGNLYLAQKVSEQEYNLLMQNDVNTSGHT